VLERKRKTNSCTIMYSEVGQNLFTDYTSFLIPHLQNGQMLSFLKTNIKTKDENEV
jgi:hypothetical protein